MRLYRCQLDLHQHRLLVLKFLLLASVFTLFSFSAVAEDMPAGEVVQLKPVETPSDSFDCIYCKISSGEKVLDFGGSKMLVRIADRKIQFDTNLNGVIEGREQRKYKREQNVVINVPFAGKTIPYTLHVHYADVLASRTCLSGRYGDFEILLLDSNVNGIFGETTLDTICVLPKDEKSLRCRAVPFFPILKIGKTIMSVEYRDGKLIVAPHKGPLATVTVEIPEKWQGEKNNLSVIYELQNLDNGLIVSPTSAFRHSPVKEVYTLPGRYKVLSSELFFRTTNTLFHLAGHGTREIELKDGPLTVEGGGGLSLQIDAVRNSDGSVNTRQVWLNSDTFGTQYKTRASYGTKGKLTAFFQLDGKQVGKAIELSYG